MSLNQNIVVGIIGQQKSPIGRNSDGTFWSDGSFTVTNAETLDEAHRLNVEHDMRQASHAEHIANTYVDPAEVEDPINLAASDDRYYALMEQLAHAQMGQYLILWNEGWTDRQFSTVTGSISAALSIMEGLHKRINMYAGKLGVTSGSIKGYQHCYSIEDDRYIMRPVD